MKFSNIAKTLQVVEQQKEKAKDILFDINLKFQYALVAGGAPRNWSFNRPANDLDIYVLRKKSYLLDEQKKIDKEFEKTIKEISQTYSFGPNKAYEKTSNAYAGFILHGLHDFTTKLENGMEQKCQFIIIDDDREYNISDMKSFSDRIYQTYDFGICMTAMDKYGNFYNSPVFEEDKKNKTFTCNIKEFRRNNNAGMQKLVERFEKMEEYFPDHKMRITC